jgi:FkbM family methyltransferase
MQKHSVHLGNYIVPDGARGGVCVDIGGNTGQFALKYRDFFRLIHIYEPQRECFNIIKNNIAPFPQIAVFDKAVYHTSGKNLTLVSHFNCDSGSVAALTDIIQVKEWTTNIVDMSCETVSLEEIMNRCGGVVDYMKIDCETSEYHFLYGKDLSNIKYMGIELHWQMGRENFERLVGHILKYFDIAPGQSYEYQHGNNIEVLFISKGAPE